MNAIITRINPSLKVNRDAWGFNGTLLFFIMIITKNDGYDFSYPFNIIV